MSLRIFDISRRKRDRKPVVRGDVPQVDPASIQSAVLQEVLDELTMMSDDELFESLLAPSVAQNVSTDSGGSESLPEEENEEKTESKGAIPTVFTEEVQGMISGLMEDESVSDAISALADDDLNSIREAISEFGVDPDKFEAESTAEIPKSPVSGIVKDETILSLLHQGIVDMSQVFEALRGRDESEDLWLSLANTEGVDRNRIFAEVARSRGFDSYPYLDAAPTREFIEETLTYLNKETLLDLLDRGLLPVDLEPEDEPGRFKVIVVSFDPMNESVSGFLKSIDLNTSLRFASQKEVEERIAHVRTWVDSSSRFGTPDGADVEGFVPVADDAHGIDPDSELDTIEVTDDVESEGVFVSEINVSRTAPKKAPDAPEMNSVAGRDRVVRSLLKKEIISLAQAEEAVYVSEAEGGQEALWRILADTADVPKELVYEEAATVYAFKHEELGPGRPDHDFVLLTMETIAESHRDEMLDLVLIPFEHELDYETGTGRIIFVTPDPTLPRVNRLLHDLDVGRFELRYASESKIHQLLDEIFPRKNEYLERIEDDTSTFDLGASYEEKSETVDEDALEAEISRSKLINLFEASLVEAVRTGASDIHIFPNPNRQVEIHFREDGRLKKWHSEDGVQPEAFIAVVKDNSTNVDRFERDAAQDGFIQRTIDDSLIRFRVSILPIASANQELRAESIVIRVLDDRKVLTDISKLGMLESALERFDQAIHQPHGMVILTGPTGSGKSTTLVAALHQVVSPEVNILTVEDPVEYIIRGVRQIKLNNKLELESALRAILRHDPDIVMVGEMRDQETAELAIKLANTGHLTFSTLHTNDAPSAVSRLYKMGVEPFLIAYAINLVVAQRLIRELCHKCKIVDENPDHVLMKSLGWTEKELKDITVYTSNRGSGCPHCNSTGFKGRRAVCETLYFSESIRHMIAEAGEAIDEDAIRTKAVEEGMLGLQASAKVLVGAGDTSVEEMLRVTGAEK